MGTFASYARLPTRTTLTSGLLHCIRYGQLLGEHTATKYYYASVMIYFLVKNLLTYSYLNSKQRLINTNIFNRYKNINSNN